ncbi:MAG: fasciclin domain-containing protein [Planctomycetes bacterium]|nr:fasciclin domain-containing protein [Planctomycetota bacterium]MCB9904708.1 fasciclin domain-containing protein [Planctomycetota bacterium]
MKTLLLLSIFALGGLATALPGDCQKQSSCTATTAAAEGKTIIDTAVAAGNFGTLATALDAAGLIETLKGKGPFTVFAPTDEAFAQLPEGTVETLLRPENKALLTSILTFHVVPGDVIAEEVVKLSHAVTVNGQRVDIRFDDKAKEVRINGAKVTTADIRCSNGTIHVIDKVIMPSTKNLVETAIQAGGFDSLATAVRAAGLAEALTGEQPLTVFAPTDEAFAQLPEGTVEALLEPENRDKLVAILQHHVVAGRVFSDQALKAGEAVTLQGGRLSIGLEEGVAYVNGAKLVATDVQASNGVIHVIDRVLLPE